MHVCWQSENSGHQIVGQLAPGGASRTVVVLEHSVEWKLIKTRTQQKHPRKDSSRRRDNFTYYALGKI